ncbi:MAG: large conductance mechanosensitive channel protein MscL [Spirochaetales bacterium]|nr:large conductance mechanosensitive channel protein MscL [Spirochaetales bacterium]
MAEEKKGFFAEFKAFITRGNVVDMAVGIIIGGLFTAIVNSFVKDILIPILGLLVGGTDFGELKVVLKAATETTEELAIRYGNLIQNIIQFILTALVLFVIIRAINRAREAAEAAKAEAEKAKEEEAK